MPAVPAFATVDPFDGMNANKPGRVQNLVAGAWADGPASVPSAKPEGGTTP